MIRFGSLVSIDESGDFGFKVRLSLFSGDRVLIMDYRIGGNNLIKPLGPG
jgi:hypothetical protein